MGIRVEFFAGRPDGVESGFLDSLPAFRQWYLELATEPASGFDLAPLTTIELIRDQGRSVLLATSMEHAAQLDEVLDVFVGDFCDWGPGKQLFPSLSKSVLYKRHYESLSGLIGSSGSPELIRFWAFLLSGRPLARDASQLPYQPSDSVFRVSFLSASEAERVRDPLAGLVSRHGRDLSEARGAALSDAAEAVDQAVHLATGLVSTVA